MAIYRPKENFASPRHRRVNRFLMRLLILIEIGAVVLVGYLFLKRDGSDIAPIEGSEIEVAEIKSSKLFESPKFTIELPNNWSNNKQLSSEQEYSFIKYRGQLTSGILTVGINKVPKDLNATYVLPISVNKDKLEVDKISNHCKEFTNGKAGKVIYMEAEFMCNPETNQGILAVAVKKGNQKVLLLDNNGKQDVYYFMYTDSTLNPNFDEVIEIIKSFKVVR